MVSVFFCEHPTVILTSVPPYLNNYFNLNTSDTHSGLDAATTFIFQKSTLQATKSFFYFTGVMEFNGIPRHIKGTQSALWLR